jgi:hypothetical protein
LVLYHYWFKGTTFFASKDNSIKYYHYEKLITDIN